MFFWASIKEMLAPQISKLFNRFFAYSFVPDQWKKTLVFSLFKNAGKLQQISSYRPISLCCSLSKIFEKLLLFQIEDHARSMNLLSAHLLCLRRPGRWSAGIRYCSSLSQGELPPDAVCIRYACLICITQVHCVCRHNTSA